jgi:hypothetical protein
LQPRSLICSENSAAVLSFSQDSQREQRSQARTRVQVLVLVQPQVQVLVLVQPQVRVLVLVQPQVQVLVLVQPQVRVLELVRVRAPVWVRKRAVAETAAAMGLSPVASSTHSRPRAEPRLTRQPKNAARFVCP